MQVLYALESIRTPWLDTVMAAITHLGEETVFMVAALFVFWCVRSATATICWRWALPERC